MDATSDPSRPTPRLDLDAALAAVRSLVPPSPLIPSPELAERMGSPVLLKLENLQVTGSFKVRGAASRILSLTPGERSRGVVTCSSGNHGKAVAWVASRTDTPATICLPEWVDPVKLEAIRGSGARTVVGGATYDEAAAAAHRLADEEGLTFVHPFDDEEVAAGQGTLALEILDQAPEVGTVVVPLSGGGLAGGVGWALAERGPGDRTIRVVAASAERARVMLESLRAGHPLEMPEEETVASALSGGIELRNRVTFALVRDRVHDHVVVTEESIRRAMAWALRSARIVVEGGGAVGLAALLEGLVAPPPDGGPVVVVVSGGNVDDAVLGSALGR